MSVHSSQIPVHVRDHSSRRGLLQLSEQKPWFPLPISHPLCAEKSHARGKVSCTERTAGIHLITYRSAQRSGVSEVRFVASKCDDMPRDSLGADGLVRLRCSSALRSLKEYGAFFEVPTRTVAERLVILSPRCLRRQVCGRRVLPLMDVPTHVQRGPVCTTKKRGATG